MEKIKLFLEHLAEKKISAQADRLLSELTSFEIGGPADLVITPKTGDEIKATLRYAHQNDIPLMILGGGSNVLFPDAGYRGAIVCTGNVDMLWREGADEIICQAGAKLSSLCKFAYTSGLSGLEFAYGIPGMVGGAVYMNAGAYGGQIEDVLHSVSFIHPDGSSQHYGRDKMGFGYRKSLFMDTPGVIETARFKLTAKSPGEIRAKMDDFMARRREKQPLEYPSAGSTFKRPSGAYASALIDECGLKGLKVGGAAVSEKHAGFVVNLGGATCNDVTTLIGQIKTRVKAQTGYELECEVRIVEV